ncbi:MAG: hypothetical protein ACLP5H_08195 [Desulfomonilaceae bacterium]
MKKGFILFAALLVVATFTVSGHAQSPFNIWPGSMPAFGGGSGPCGPSGPPLFGSPTFYVGWMESVRRAAWSFADPNPGSSFGGAHRYPLSGLWLGLEEKINFNETCGLDLDGWVLIPSNRQGSEQEPTLTISTSSAVVTTTPGVGNRTWNTRTEWWYLDAAATWACCTPFKLLAGFRYDHFSTRFDNPTNAFGVVFTPDDTADLTVNSYLPFVGLQTSVGGPASNVMVRWIGFPVAPANLTFSETNANTLGTRVDSTGNWNHSYWTEIFAEYNRNFAAGMGIGAFFRWHLYHGQANLTTNPLGLVGVSSDASFDRNAITLGGNIQLNFGSPL